MRKIGFMPAATRRPSPQLPLFEETPPRADTQAASDYDSRNSVDGDSTPKQNTLSFLSPLVPPNLSIVNKSTTYGTSDQNKINIGTFDVGTGTTRARGTASLPRIPQAVKALQTLWNDIAAPTGLQAWQFMPKARVQAAQARLREFPDLAGWAHVVRVIAASKFCHGHNDRGWRADVAFLLRTQTYARAHEGVIQSWDRGIRRTAEQTRQDIRHDLAEQQRQQARAGRGVWIRDGSHSGDDDENA